MRHARKTWNLPVFTIGVPTATALVYREDAAMAIVLQASQMCRRHALLGWPAWLGPDDEEARAQWACDRGNASCSVRSVWIKERDKLPPQVMACIDPLETENGSVLEKLLGEDMIELGVRAYGKLEDGSTIVEASGLKLIAIDALPKQAS